MVGRLHSRQGPQSGRGAAGEGPSLLLDISFFFLPPGEWMCKPLTHITVIITSLWYSSAHSQKKKQKKKRTVLDRNTQTLVWSLFFRVSPIYRETSCSFFVFCHIILSRSSQIFSPPLLSRKQRTLQHRFANSGEQSLHLHRISDKSVKLLLE